ncbi:MAG: acetyl-CoA carboxylase biotin carboxyl carrier protein subunit [Cyclobacteriaceae bacterium]
MQHATVNNKTFEIIQKGGELTVDGQPFAWDLIKISEGHFHILYKNKTYRAEMVKRDVETKTYTIKLNGKTHSVKLKDKFDLLLEKMGIADAGATKLNHIKAPMPGLIIDLKVKAGDSVKTGDALLILEAMKMENILKSPGDGIVKNVKVKKGDSVEKSQVLVEF